MPVDTDSTENTAMLLEVKRVENNVDVFRFARISSSKCKNVVGFLQCTLAEKIAKKLQKFKINLLQFVEH